MNLIDIVGALGLAAAFLAMLGHIVVTLRNIHATVRKIQRDVEELNEK